MLHRKLYKLDTTARLRFWQIESEGAQFRTIAGLDGSKGTVSGWTTCTAASQDTDEAQCSFEVEAKYRHQLDREYHETPDTVGTPNFFEPMLAKTYADYPGRCYAQPKLDGIRCIARAEGLFTRQGQPIIAVPHIHAALAPLFEADPDLTLDGELYNHDLKDDFGAVSSIVRKKKPTADQLAIAERVMQYHVYDLPSHGGNFGDRSVALLGCISRLECPWIVWVATDPIDTQEQLDEMYGRYLEHGYEGQMVRLDAPYEQKRSKTLLKRKEFITREYPLVRFEAGNGNWAGAAKRAVLRNDDGTEFGAGVKGKYDDLVNLIGVEGGEVTLRFFQLSPDGVPRFPVVTDYHPNGRAD